jgi:hypothetical protein
VAGATGAVVEGFRKPALAYAHGATEDHVLLRGGEPVEAEELAHARAVIVHRALPHELVVGDDLVEPRSLDAAGQALAIPAVDLILEQQLEELCLACRAWVARSGKGGSKPPRLYWS